MLDQVLYDINLVEGARRVEAAAEGASDRVGRWA
jgi:hypothetical protein